MNDKNGGSHSGWRLHAHFDIDRHVPTRIEIQAYGAIIACLLISLWTGRKPTLRSYEMICLYFAGWASLE